MVEKKGVRVWRSGGDDRVQDTMEEGEIEWRLKSLRRVKKTEKQLFLQGSLLGNEEGGR